MDSNSWKQDIEYNNYIDSGESNAVFVIKNYVNCIEARHTWVDVISLNMYYKRNAYLPAFNWIVVEVFPRRLNPKYTTHNIAYRKYLTWKTAHQDISEQRKNGVCGEKFIVLCHLFDKNQNKFREQTIYARKYWEPLECYRNMSIKIPLEPEWDYKIQSVQKISTKQVNYIQNHEDTILAKILSNGKPTLDLFKIK